MTHETASTPFDLAAEILADFAERQQVATPAELKDAVSVMAHDLALSDEAWAETERLLFQSLLRSVKQEVTQ